MVGVDWLADGVGDVNSELVRETKLTQFNLREPRKTQKTHLSRIVHPLLMMNVEGQREIKESEVIPDQ